MSTAMNHRKRSHRSHSKHFNQARILRRQNAARAFEKSPLMSGFLRSLRAKILHKPERAAVAEKGGEEE